VGVPKLGPRLNSNLGSSSKRKDGRLSERSGVDVNPEPIIRNDNYSKSASAAEKNLFLQISPKPGETGLISPQTIENGPSPKDGVEGAVIDSNETVKENRGIKRVIDLNEKLGKLDAIIGQFSGENTSQTNNDVVAGAKLAKVELQKEANQQLLDEKSGS